MTPARRVLLRIANEINESFKGAKATVDEDADVVRFNMEWFQEGVPSAQLLERILSMLAAVRSR